jgi:hypothetical protein
MNPPTDCASHRAESIFRAFARIIRDKRLNVVSGYRTSVDKGHDEAAMFNRAPWWSTTDVCVIYKTSPCVG